MHYFPVVLDIFPYKMFLSPNVGKHMRLEWEKSYEIIFRVIYFRRQRDGLERMTNIQQTNIKLLVGPFQTPLIFGWDL